MYSNAKPVMLLFRRALKPICFGLALGALILAVHRLIVASNTTGSFWGVDFHDYWLAGGRVLAGHVPYASDMLAGPFSAIGQDRFRYPPPFALIIAPLAWLPLTTATWVWTSISATLMLVGCLLAARAGGVRLSLLSVSGIIMLLCFCLPATDNLLTGNVEALQVLLIGLALTASPPLTAAVTGLLGLLKIAPVMAWPAVIIRDPRSAAKGFALMGLGLIVTAPWLAGAWAAFPTVLINQWLGGGSGGADASGNFALAHVASTLAPGGPVVELVARAISLGLAGTLLGLSLLWSRKDTGWPAALLAGITAGLLVPATLWLQYFALLIPFALFAWPRLGTKSRTAVVVLLLGLRFGAPVITAIEDILISGLVVGLLFHLRPRPLRLEKAIINTDAAKTKP